MMEILSTLVQIPVMLFVSLAAFPLALWAYSRAVKPKKTVSALNVDPAEMLKEKKIDSRRELKSGIFLGAALAFPLAAGFFIVGLVNDYKNDRGIFAPALEANALPPAPNYVLPPAPAAAAQTEVSEEEN